MKILTNCYSEINEVPGTRNLIAISHVHRPPSHFWKYYCCLSSFNLYFDIYLGPVSRKTLKLFRPVKPLAMYYAPETYCMKGTSVHIKNM